MYPQRRYFCVYPVSTVFHRAGGREDAIRVGALQGTRQGVEI